MSDAPGNGRSPQARQCVGLKPTQVEHRQRLREVAELWARHCRPDEIRAAMQAKWGMSRQAVDRYMRAARDMVVKASQVPISELVARSYATYARIVRDPDATNAERISAQRAIDDLFSLPKARKIAITTTDGLDVLQAVVDQLPPELVDAMYEVSKRVDDARQTGVPAIEGPG